MVLCAEILEVVRVRESLLLRDPVDPAAEADPGDLLFCGVAFGADVFEGFAQFRKLRVIFATE